VLGELDQAVELSAHHLSPAYRAAQRHLVEHCPDLRCAGPIEDLQAFHAEVHVTLDRGVRSVIGSAFLITVSAYPLVWSRPGTSIGLYDLMSTALPSSQGYWMNEASTTSP
jgi:hypothetical protein